MKYRETIIEIITVLYILLFIYAGASKLLDYEAFEIQLHKSPMLVNMSSLIAWIIPGIEIAIAILLIFPSMRLKALYCSVTLMLLFTFYIVAILGYSDYIPCSCGGILQKLGWKEHLLFNIFFSLIGIIAIMLSSEKKLDSLLFTLMIIIGSGLFITMLFRSTYEEQDQYNSFNITMLKEGCGIKDSVNLGVNSYYFAGRNSDTIFLGNETVPGNIWLLNTGDFHAGFIRKVISPFAGYQSRIKILNNRAYVSDGEKRRVENIDINNLSSIISHDSLPYFSDFTPVSPHLCILKVLDKKNEFTLALFQHDSGVTEKPDILRKQIDGRFDVDGILFYNEQLQRPGYLHFYTNQFITSDSLLTSPYFRRTIDTIRTAKIRVSTVRQNDKQSTILIPTLTVNRHVFYDSSLLFIESGIRAKNEKKSNPENNIRIDVYEFIAGNYIGSFYLPDAVKARDYIIAGNNLYYLRNSYLYQLDIKTILRECREIIAKRNFTGR